MAITVTITQLNVTDNYGRALSVGTSYSLPDDLARSIIYSQRGTDTNNVLASLTPTGPVAIPSYTWANRPALASSINNVIRITDVGGNLNGAGGGNFFFAAPSRWKPVGGNVIIDAVDTPNTSAANTSENQLNPNHILIPAGVISINDRLRIRATFTKSNTAENATLRFRFGTAGTTADALIATITSLAGANQSEGVLLDFKLTSLTAIQKLGNATTDQSYGGVNSALTPNAVTVSDVSANGMYLSITSQVNVGVETVTLQDYSLELYPTDSN